MDLNLIIPVDKKIYHTTDLMELGLTYYKINKLILNGKLRKLNKSYYENIEYNGEDTDLYYVTAYAPAGIVCLLSAAVHYGLTNYRPEVIEVAIPKNKNIVTVPDWPIIKLYYFDDDRYQIGITKVQEGRNEFKIYDIEKTVVDIIYYRNKIGIEETKEILTNYLQKKDRNLNQLMRYSEKLKCYEILKTYLEVLI